MLIVLSGCSGGGKSTLLNILAARNFCTMAEVGRQIVKEQLASGGSALPWRNESEFADLCLRRGIVNYNFCMKLKGPVIFDRSIVDAISAIEHMEKYASSLLQEYIAEFRYYKVVYFTPPWAAIYTTDSERKHSLDDAIREYERLRISYRKYGYEIVELPLIPVMKRADHLQALIRSEVDAG